MQAINELRITDVDSIVEGDKECFEDRTVEAFWDDNVEIIVEVMNRFNDNNDEGQDAEIEVEVEIEGDTDEVDLDDKREDVDVDADEKEELSFSGRIEDDARGKIKLEITAKGRDDNGALHCDFTIGKFDVFEGYRPTVFNSDLIDNRDETINFTPFPENDEQTTPTAAQPQDEPREETVEPVVQIAPVSRDKFRDGNGYAWLLGGMILLMLAVLAAEIAYIMHKRKQLKEQEFYGETYETVEQ